MINCILLSRRHGSEFLCIFIDDIEDYEKLVIDNVIIYCFYLEQILLISTNVLVMIKVSPGIQSRLL